MPFLASLKKIYYFVLGLSVLCLIVVVSSLWQQQSRLSQNQKQTQVVTPTPFFDEVDSDQIQKSLTASIATYSARVDQVELELASLRQQLATSSAIKKLPTTTSFTKETLYLGSTSTNNREWSETGLEIGINSAHYPAGVTVKLEASLSIIGGEAWVRLKNKSTGAVISLSEISNNTSSANWKLSPSFHLHDGGYTYVLEARSTSGETANISGARLIIEK